MPLIASFPGRFGDGRRVDAVTSLLDVGPTMIDLAGGDPLPEVAGRSLRCFLEGDGRSAAWVNETFSENYSGADEPPARMVRQGPWKLNTYYGYDEPQLFNLEVDPQEFEDRAGDTACAEVKAALLARVLEGWDGGAVGPRLQRRTEGRRVLREWAGAVEHDLADFWRAPQGCNVFPEE